MVCVWWPLLVWLLASRYSLISCFSTAVLLTDGESNSPDETVLEARKVHSSGINVYSVGILNAVNEDELIAIASEPSK